MADMRPGPWHSNDFLAIVGTEIAYFVIVVLLCMIIYFKTREIYDLTKYKGLFYFRNTFLFFAIAYFFRLLQSLYVVLARTTDFAFFPPWYLIPIVLFLTAYFSSMAILSLTFSTIWKRVETQTINQDIVLNLIAIGIALITFLTRSPMFLVAIQLILIIFAVAMAYSNSKSEKKTFLSRLHITYILLFVFWITSLLVLARIPFLSLEFRAPLYAISVIVLLSIAYRVVRRL